MRKLSILLLALALAAALAACGGKDKSDAPGNASGNPAGGAAEETNPISGESPDSPDQTDQTGQPEAAEPELAPAGEAPPETMDIVLEVEGMTETRTGTLAMSENGYYLYTLPLFAFTPEEPLMDQVYMETYPDYFMRIQPLGTEVDVAAVKAVAEEELRDLGEVVEWKGEQIYNPFIREHAHFHLHAIKQNEVTKYILLMEIDGQFFRIMIHMPHGEASEGAGPSFEAMIGTITPIGGPQP